MSNIDPIGPPAIGPAVRITRVSRGPQREEEPRGHDEEPEDEPAEEEPPPDDRPKPQHIDIRG